MIEVDHLKALGFGSSSPLHFWCLPCKRGCCLLCPEILFGTTNPGKFRDIEVIAKSLPVCLRSPLQLGLSLHVEEHGSRPEDNARIKAEAYCQAAGMPSMAVDSGLFIDGLSDAQQPGTHVRRVGGVPLSDEAMLEHYSQVIRDLGGHATARWITAVVGVLPDGRSHAVTISNPTKFTAEVCAERTPGNPLNSMQIDPRTGRYHAQEQPQEIDDNGAANAFQEKVYALFLHFLRMLE